MDTTDTQAQTVGDLIRKAFLARASDIHLEPG